MRILNLFLPLVWMGLTGDFSFANFGIGIVLTSLVLLVTIPRDEVLLLIVVRLLWGWGALLLYFAWALLRASLQVVFDVLTPRHRMRPVILAIPLDLARDEQITLLANLISLTPGTLSLDVSPGCDELYVHAMYVDDIEAYRRSLKTKYESRVRRVLP